MLIYVQTIVNNFSCVLYSPRHTDKSSARLNNCSNEYSVAKIRRSVISKPSGRTSFIIMLVINLTVTYIAGHLSSIFTICPSLLNSEMNSRTSPLPKLDPPPPSHLLYIRIGPLEQSINSPRSQSAQIQLFLKP